MTAGALGCFESHVHAWERVVAEGTPAVIFEDDVVLRDDFDPWMSRVLENLPSGVSGGRRFNNALQAG